MKKVSCFKKFQFIEIQACRHWKRARKSTFFPAGAISNRHKIPSLVCFFLIASLACLLAVAGPVGANIITVNTTNDEVNDSADCSLREAVIAANMDAVVDGCGAGSGADEIVFAPEVIPGMFILAIAGAGEDAAATGDLDITDDLTISGAGASSTIIDADEIDRVFHIIGSVTVHLEGLTIQNGFVTNGLAGGGGGIVIQGGNLELTNSIVSDNIADFGGGIVNEASVVNIFDCTIARNTAIQSAAGISNRGGLLQISNSTITGNHIDLPFTEGGGVRNVFGGTVVLVNSTVSDNSASFGGGINNDTGSLTIINSTIAGNAATNSAGGMGIENGPVELQNTIIANNTAPVVSPNCGFSGLITSLGNNLIGDNTGCDITFGPGDIISEPGTVIDPRLGPFTDDGSPGRGYFPLLPDSPAIDAANDESCPVTDQIGNSRSDGDSDGTITCDIGAIEFQAEVIAVQIDIDPHHGLNLIYPRSKGLVWVAVLSESDFDPSQIQISTVRFGPDGATPVRHKIRDINRDGIGDLLLLFKIRATGIACGDTEETLTGETVDGLRFSGTDSVKTIGCFLIEGRTLTSYLNWELSKGN
jgi:CSLREA domain-containing protein